MRRGILHRHTVCIGCRLRGGLQGVEPAAGHGLFFTAMSYDNTAALGAATWRHVSFIERPCRSPQETGSAISPGS